MGYGPAREQPVWYATQVAVSIHAQRVCSRIKRIVSHGMDLCGSAYGYHAAVNE